MLVGVGERGALGRPSHSQVREFTLTAGQPTNDLSQRFGLSQLAKQHRDQLRPASESLGVFLGLMPDGLFEFSARQQTQHLRKDAAYSMQGGFPLG